MVRKRNINWQLSPTYGQDPAQSLRLCDHPDCSLTAEYRAPRSRDAIREYYWFCLDHVRPYNAAWNFYAGMTDDEVEQELQKDTFWHRPTWPLGDRKSTVGRGRVGDPFGLFDDGPGGGPGGGPNAGRDGHNGRANGFGGRGHDKSADQEYMHGTLGSGGRQTEALAVMDLRPPVSVSALKARYKQLVKRHHPDANGGSRQAEERLKAINIAYGTLMQAIET
ncbi:MAG: J domain-containing protein [Alphaproteobacteria bacterium]|nr:J domain-containing protein [Alphaproteobacteria bacterium]